VISSAKYARTAAAALLAALLWQGCESKSEPVKPYTIKGTARDGFTGQPAAGVRVSDGRDGGVTGADGRYEFSGQSEAFDLSADGRPRYPDVQTIYGATGGGDFVFDDGDYPDPSTFPLGATASLSGKLFGLVSTSAAFLDFGGSTTGPDDFGNFSFLMVFATRNIVTQPLFAGELDASSDMTTGFLRSFAGPYFIDIGADNHINFGTVALGGKMADRGFSLSGFDKANVYRAVAFSLDTGMGNSSIVAYSGADSGSIPLPDISGSGFGFQAAALASSSADFSSNTQSALVPISSGPRVDIKFLGIPVVTSLEGSFKSMSFKVSIPDGAESTVFTLYDSGWELIWRGSFDGAGRGAFRCPVNLGNVAFPRYLSIESGSSTGGIYRSGTGVIF
jgi:hypothetical protein